METFAQRLTQLRIKKSLTQREVAKALGIPLSTYKEWEYGRRIQAEEVYARLAEVLEVSLKALLTGERAHGKEDLIEKVDVALKHLNEVKSSLISF